MPVEPRLVQSDPDTAVFDATQRTQMLLLVERRYVGVETRQNAVATITPIYTDILLHYWHLYSAESPCESEAPRAGSC